jgi:class 3 adenylate cyclase
MVAMINSILTNNWLVPLGLIERGLCILGVCMLAMLLATLLRPAVLAFVGPLILGGIIFGGLRLFVSLNLLVPWLMCALAYALTIVVVASERSLSEAARTKRIKMSLAGLVDADKLRELVKNPAALRLGPSQQDLTLMFIDIVGFSLTAEGRAPADVFGYLQDILSELTETVHRYGGVVDKTLGDGMLCFFGYSFSHTAPEGKAVRNHADQAVRCAIDIQKANLRRNLLAQAESRPVFPLRIGINTGEVYIGDLGSHGRVEFTVIGHGVNLAERLQSACESFAIMCGTETRRKLSHSDAQSVEPGMKKRLIKIKHHDQLVEAFELNPFFDAPDALRSDFVAFRQYMGLKRKETRVRAKPYGGIKVQTPYGDGVLVDFSQSGFCVELFTYLGRGVAVAMSLSGLGVEQTLRRRGIQALEVDVQWGRPKKDGGFLHGVQLKNLTVAQRDELFECLCEGMGLDPRAPEGEEKAVS